MEILKGQNRHGSCATGDFEFYWCCMNAIKQYRARAAINRDPLGIAHRLTSEIVKISQVHRVKIGTFNALFTKRVIISSYGNFIHSVFFFVIL